MNILPRLVGVAVLVGMACLLAGAFGMVHNQISYTIGPDYFHVFKFHQFRIAEPFQNRIGAAIVGWRASWWMGLVIGIPIGAMTLGIAPPALARAAFFRASLRVVLITLALGLFSLAFAPPMAHIAVPVSAKDPIGFGRAAMLHDTTYLAGLIGLFAGLIFVGGQIRRARRDRLNTVSGGGNV